MKLANNGSNTFRKRKVRGSFSLWDLAAILVVLVVFGIWFVFEHTGERGRIARCAGNLKMLGEATQSYANDHNDGLPAAVIGIGKQIISWDTALAPYLEPGMAKAKSQYDKRRLAENVSSYFVCPSDPIKRNNPRSYAMSGRHVEDKWPATAEDKTGVGMFWNKHTISTYLDKDLARKAMENPDLLPRIKQSMLPDPAHTLLYTELISPNNHMGFNRDARVMGINQQKEGFHGDSSHFHFGKFNYLMADGHVELLFAKQTQGRYGKSHNIWTINAED